jgi:hypothetical protein
MTGTNCDLFTQIVLVIFEPPCICLSPLELVNLPPTWISRTEKIKQPGNYNLGL